MKLRYTIEETSKNGAKDTLNNDFDRDEIIIGRGSAADIRFSSSYVSLNHARLTFKDGKLHIEDLGSLSGVQVNGDVVQFHALESGDKIKLGDVVLHVSFSGGIWILLEKREEREEEDREKLVERDLAKLSIVNRLPRMVLISTVLMLICAVYYFFIPVFGGNAVSWSSGPVSNRHSMIAGDCQACHATPFQRVADQQCLACHKMDEHAEALSKHASLEPRCASCHMEHNGDRGLILRDSRLCVDCHADIKSVHPESKVQDIPSFLQHPEFSVAIQPAFPGGSYTRVRLDRGEDELRDNSNVKLNHEIHLTLLRTKDGKVRLDCRDCHNASPDLKTIEPINYEKHCSNCHGLEFDDRLAGKEVPHGSPDVVYKFLYAEYAKLLLSSEDSAETRQVFNRFKPGGSIAANAEAASAGRDDFRKAFVEKESRNAERLLFTKTACYLCHRVTENGISAGDANKNAVSMYAVMQPQIPVRWMPESIFNHGAHEAVRCDDCHEGVYQSTRTNQILLPKVKKCQECHTEEGGSNASGQAQVKSDCVMCHSFHDQLLFDFGSKRTTSEILSKVHPQQAK